MFLLFLSSTLALAALAGCATTKPYVGDLGGTDTRLYFAEAHGRLYPYRVYFPSSYRYVQSPKAPDFQPSPLLVACHSSGADETWYFEFKGQEERLQTIAEERGYVVAAPAGPGRQWHNDPRKMDPETFQEKGGLCKPESIDVITEVVREMIKQMWIDKSRAYLTGASSGAIAAYGTAAKYPETYAAVAGVCGAFTDDMIEGLTNVPVLMFNAQLDKTFDIERIREKKAELEAAGGNVTLHEVPTKHGGYRNLKSYKVLFDFFDKHRRELGSP